MNKTDVHKSIRSIKLGKIINLKNSDIITNSSKNKTNYLDNESSLNTVKNKGKIYFSYNGGINPENFKNRKMTHVFNEKNNYSINENIIVKNLNKIRKMSDNIYFNNNNNRKILLPVKNENNMTNDAEIDNINKVKNLKLSLQAKTIYQKDFVDNNDTNSIIKSDNKNNKLLKNYYQIKNPKISNNDLNQYSINTISIKHHMTTESTKSEYIPTEKDSISYNKLNKIKLGKSLNKSNLHLSNDISEFNIHKKIKDSKTYDKLMKIRRKYPFIVNHKPLMPKKFLDLPKRVKRTNKNYFNILINENEKLFNQYFCIIAKEKFSKKFQNIGNLMDFENMPKQNQKIKNEKKILNDLEEIDNSLINENIISGYKLLKELNSDTRNIIKSKIKLSKKLLYAKFKKELIFLSSKLNNISVYINEVIENYRKPKHSYFYPNSHELFFAIKSRNLKLAENILNTNKNLVLDFDYFRMTAIHWAAKYNFYQIIPKLFEYGSHMNDTNYIGDTPLLISIKHKFMTSVIFLLLYLASPFVKDKRGFDVLHYSKYDFRLNNILKKIIKLHYMSMLGKTKNKLEFIQRKFSRYIINEYKNDLENDAYIIISEKVEFFKRKNVNN
jgi:hypothetical protein